MKIFTIKILLLFFILQTAAAQDTIFIDNPGIVGGEWTPEHRYIARSNILVPYDSVLTIHPGVKIEFQEGFVFKVEGQLFANGTQNNMIEIKPYQEDRWKGMNFGTPSGEQNMNASQLSFIEMDCGNLMDYQAILLGKHMISSINNINLANAYIAIKITGSATIDNIRNCSFESVDQAIVYQYNDIVSQVLIENCTFENIFDRAIYISHNPAYLDNVIIRNCGFDNSALGDNNSGSALYVTANDQLISVTLNSNTFKSFSQQINSTACIYIAANENLSDVNLTGNNISLCGGETPTSPNADFGGILIDKSLHVLLDDNDISDNTGIKSGIGFIHTDRYTSFNNSFQENRNSYTGNGFFAGAITFSIGDRIEMNEDSFNNNFSAKSGGAFIVESEDNSNPIDLKFNTITLSTNNSANEGGAVLINATIDTLKIFNSIFTANFSSAGSGGCFSLISSAFNDLLIESNTLQDNFVSEFSDGGFLYLIHDPSVTPSYGNILFDNNTNAASGHNNDRNYSIFYSKISSFPKSIGITNENVSNCYPVIEYLYHFELLQSGPFSTTDELELTLTDNDFKNNRCPVLYISNDYCPVTSNISGNIVEGYTESFGTFLTLECEAAAELNFENEAYSNLISVTSGGAVTVRTIKETGNVNILGVTSKNCFSAAGDGGHFSFVSGSSDPAQAQSLSISDAHFSNEDIAEYTGGNGGAVYLQTPGNIDSIILRSCFFELLNTEGSGGALFVDAQEINKISILGSEFEVINGREGDGAISLIAGDGNIKELLLASYNDDHTSFSQCGCQQYGGAISLRASKEIGKVLIDGVLSYNCTSNEGNGGHISLVSLSSDAAVSQDLIITNSTFDNTAEDPWGNNGGALYYTTPGRLDSLYLNANSFISLDVHGNGGAIFLDAKEIGEISLLNSGFGAVNSLNAAGGALYISASNGNIGKIDNINSDFMGCTSKLDGGAMFIKASKEIGPVIIDSSEFKSCSSAEGNGGHIMLASLSSDPSLSQELVIANSIFHNPNTNNPSGGNGGAVYYKTPGNLDSIKISLCTFTKLNVIKTAGALFLDAREISKVVFTGSQFSLLNSLDTAGAVYIHASNGNISELSVAPFENTLTSFTSCASRYDGGALCVIASKEIGSTLLDTVVFENCYSSEGNGGHLSLISLGADPTLNQELNIRNSSFSNSGISSVTGGNGGVVSYTASSDVASIMVINSGFDKIKSAKNGGSIYLNADKIVSLSVNGSDFSSSASEVLSGGAIYLKSAKGFLNGSFDDNKFSNCTSNLYGGSIFIEDDKYDNPEENISWTSNIYSKEVMQNIPDNGGAVYCKGVKTVSFIADSVINQTASIQGGFLYLEKVYDASLEGVYAYNNSSGSGGVVYHLGDEQSAFNQSSRINNSTFLFNNALQTGGCFYLTNIDLVEIGQAEGKNVFVGNQSQSAINDPQVGGGTLFVQNVFNLSISDNSFYVNKSGNNGGVGVINNVSSSMLIENNSFLSNQANAGGTFAFFNTLTGGSVTGNKFYYNSSAEQGGAILFAPSANNNVQVRDNTFFQNKTGNLGGAISAYRPVHMTRNLFRENKLSSENPLEDQKGTAVYMTGAGNQTLVKNCVFDRNLSSINKAAGIYFDASQSLPAISIFNCSFFNLDKYLSLYNASTQDTVAVINSIFTIRDGVNRDDSVIYINETVKARYSDLIYTDINDTINHLYDEYVYFTIGDYFFDSSQFPVDKGDPAPAYYDNPEHFPPAYGTSRNDLGISGGPDNPDSVGTFLFNEPAPLSSSFDIVVTSSECFQYSFECRGDYVAEYEFFYWFFPDTIIKTETPYLDYTFSFTTTGSHIITVMGQDTDNDEAFGYGQYSANLDIIKIISLDTEFENNAVPVPYVPFAFTVTADIYVAGNASIDNTDWRITGSEGVIFTMMEYETSNVINIDQITAPSPFINLEYEITACGRTRIESIEIQLVTTDQWGYPLIGFYPTEEDIPDNITSIEIIFDKRMTDINGNLLVNSDVANYLLLVNPCGTITFLYEVVYGINETKFILSPVNVNTQLPDTLCDGEYFITVYGQNLYSENYGLPGTETTKPYYTDIFDIPGNYAFKVYPNPFRDNIHINFSTQDDYIIEITDLRGQVQKKGYYPGISEITLNLAPLSRGLYLLHVVNAKNTKHLIMKINKITQ